jgi:hypothetical protein
VPAWREIECGERLGRPWRHGPHGLVEIDSRCAPAEIRRAQQGGDRHGDKARIGEIEVSIRKRQPTRFGQQMHRASPVLSESREIEMFENSEHLLHRDSAGCGELRSADTVTTIAVAQSGRLLGPVSGEVRKRHAAMA